MLHLHRAERADALAAALRDVLADPLEDPFATEVICVPTRGMERWLTQRMSDRLGATPGRTDGICANVAFPSPAALVRDAVAAASGIDPERDPWLPERAVWPLLEVVDANLGEPWLRALAAHLGATSRATAEPTRGVRRFSTVRHLAGLFDRYALQRPSMLRAWAGGEDVGATGSPLAPDARWQAELWRHLRGAIAEPDPAARLDAACARLRADPHLLDLPPRISLFGLTRLPTGHLGVLRALAATRDVHLFLLHPSPALWERVRASLEDRPPVVRRDDDPTATLAANRLLASWGHDARELQLVLRSADDEQVDHHHPVSNEAVPATLLIRVQADVRADRPPPGAPLATHDDARPLLEPDDESIQVHSCHGRARQVEVLRDAILHLLEEDPSLEPRDVIVMCPDIETFAPLIHATFGAGDIESEDVLAALPDDARPPDLRVRLADRSLRQTNPVLGVVAQLIDLADRRLTASEVLDLADREPVRRRFGFDDEDLARLEDWVADTGIRWGLDAEHRAPFKLDDLPNGTWRAGLDRVLVGVAMTEDEHRLFAGVLPLDDVESGAIDLAGRLAEFIDRLQAAVDALTAPKPLDAWVTTIAAAADALAATSTRDAWQRSELQRLLDDVQQEATVDDTTPSTTLALAEVRALLGDRLQGRPTRANFRTGHLTVCTLMPMRSVPHRVVCLLGMDDGAFPRKTPRDGDDLVLSEPHVGDRDPRTEDRQMLLDALLAATDRLVVTYTGHDERTNTPRPPAVPVGELLDVVDRTVRTPGGGRARDHVVVTHPLQPFDPRNFTVGRLVRDRAWSFDRVTLDGARALTGKRTDPQPFLAGPLAGAAAPLVAVEDLVRFVEHPVRAFLRQRLGISVGEFSDEVEDGLAIELDALEKWGVGQSLIDARLAGADPRAAVLAELARGTLPPGLLAKPVVEDVAPRVDRIVEQVEALLGIAADPASVDVNVRLDTGRALTGTVPGVCGDMLRTVTYSRVNARHRLALWARLLALTASHPERPFAAAVVGRARAGAKNATVTVARLGALGTDAATRRERAVRELAGLIDLYDRGMREPLPVACMTSAAYAEATINGANPRTAARKAWESDYGYDKEDKDPEHVLVHGGVLTLDELLAQEPRTDEVGDAWQAAEPSRFGRYARRLWSPLLAHEEVTDR